MIAVVEIPMGSFYKIEKDEASGTYKIDRVINQRIPYNYGFFPGTLCDDGDPLDVFIITRDRIQTGIVCEANVIGGFKCVDHGKQDDKLVAQLPGEEWTKEELDQAFKNIANYLLTYKQDFIIQKHLDVTEALEIHELSYRHT